MIVRNNNNTVVIDRHVERQHLVELRRALARDHLQLARDRLRDSDDASEGLSIYLSIYIYIYMHIYIYIYI